MLAVIPVHTCFSLHTRIHPGARFHEQVVADRWMTSDLDSALITASCGYRTSSPKASVRPRGKIYQYRPAPVFLLYKAPVLLRSSTPVFLPLLASMRRDSRGSTSHILTRKRTRVFTHFNIRHLNGELLNSDLVPIVPIHHRENSSRSTPCLSPDLSRIISH